MVDLRTHLLYSFRRLAASYLLCSSPRGGGGDRAYGGFDCDVVADAAALRRQLLRAAARGGTLGTSQQTQVDLCLVGPSPGASAGNYNG